MTRDPRPPLPGFMAAGASRGDGGGRSELMQVVAVLVIVCFGAILGAVATWWPLRHRPTVRDLQVVNKLYRERSEAYKSLCVDARTGIELAATHANLIHASNQTESSSKIIAVLDNLIVMLRERESNKAFTPFDGTFIGRHC